MDEMLRRHGLPTVGVGGEIAHDMVEDARRDMQGWRGVIPAAVVNAEPVQVLGGGTQVLVTFDIPEGGVQLAVSLEDAAGLAARLHDIAGSARLILPQDS